MENKFKISVRGTRYNLVELDDIHESQCHLCALSSITCDCICLTMQRLAGLDEMDINNRVYFKRIF